MGWENLTISALSRVFLFLTLAWCGLVNLPHFVSFGSVSLSGVATVILAGVAWLLFVFDAGVPRRTFRATAPVLLFVGWTALGVIWHRPSVAGIQNFLVYWGGAGLLILSAREGWRRPDVTSRLWATLRVAAWVAAALFLVILASGMVGSMKIVGPRAFAMFALIGVAAWSARTRYRGAPALVPALLLVTTIVSSLSRAAIFLALLSLALPRLRFTTLWGWVKGVLAILLVAAASYMLVTQIEAIKGRFVGGDRAVLVGTVHLNTSGRVTFWSTTIESLIESPWVGKGSGTAQTVIEIETMGSSNMNHPHNDYLRLLHDFGAVGLGLFVLAQAAIFVSLLRGWLWADRRRHPLAEPLLASLLAFISVSLIMVTDNPIVYVFVVAPMGILLGATIGATARLKEG